MNKEEKKKKDEDKKKDDKDNAGKIVPIIGPDGFGVGIGIGGGFTIDPSDGSVGSGGIDFW